jgi:hypothetical protein
MMRSLLLAATALALSGAAASAQIFYATPGYGYGVPAYVAPTYVAPAYMAPPPVYVVPSAPLYGYAPGYVDTYTVGTPDWGW